MFEGNEAFTGVAMMTMRDLGLPQERLNTNGRACVPGIPSDIRGRKWNKGVVTLCIGGSETAALALEMVS